MPSSKGSKLFRRLSDAFSAAQEAKAGSNPTPAQEFYALAEVQLGSSYDRHKLDAVAAIQSWLQHEQDQLSDQLDSQEMGPERYFDLMNALQYEAAVQTEAILGKVDFERLFGVSVNETKGLADRDTFLAEHASQHATTKLAVPRS